MPSLPRHPVLDLVGGTPLLDLSSLCRSGPGASTVRLYAKAEHLNPGGSVKDRPALSMIRAAVAAGALRPGGGGPRILDATSGNTGIAYAMIGAALGIGVTLCLPANASPERKQVLRAYGAEIVETDPLQGSDGAILRARELAEGAGYVHLDQYGNDANWRAHFETTGPEILEQTGGAITHFLAALGTSGTFMGVGRFLRGRAPEVRLISMQPATPLHGLEGLKHMASAIVPPIYDPELADEDVAVETEVAYAMTRRLAREHGLLVGISAGANVAAALRLADALDEGVLVTILCDGGQRYLSDPLWEEGS